MVDDEPGGFAEALGAEPGPVAVSGQDEQVRAGCRGHHFLFGVTVASDPVARAAEAAGGGGGEQFGGTQLDPNLPPRSGHMSVTCGNTGQED